MSTSPTNEPTRTKPLRLWPGVVAGIVVVAGFTLPVVFPSIGLFGMLGAVVGALALILWWIFFSRAPWLERAGGIVLLVVGLLATRLIVHESISGGMMGRMVFVYGTIVLSLALVLGPLASRRRAAGFRRGAMVAMFIFGCAAMALVRTGGITGGGNSDLHWRWTKTPEERLLAQARNEPLDAAPGGVTAPPTVAPAEIKPLEKSPVPPAGKPASPSTTASTNKPATSVGVEAGADRPAMSEPGFKRVEWPGFRGPNRDGIVKHVRINTDWAASPPVQLWRRPIGPGWSSFAVRGDLIYTQEQRGEEEVVSSYRLTTGLPVWRHRDAARFYESNGGPGPRGTPTLANGRLYTLGATGILNALDASSGGVVWSRNAVTDTGVMIPGWGIASSPLVVDDMVIVAASGRLAAYDAATGKPRWFRSTGGGGYSSPQLTTFDGVPQILLLSGGGAIGVAPTDGAVLWQHALWQSAIGIVQPAAVDDELLIAAGDAMGGIGMRRLAVAHGPSGWTAEERWTSRGLKPYFNDFVVHRGHAFGFDGNILSCIDIKDGARKWKGGRYGSGQLILLADQDLLLVISEDGDLALVKATSDQFTEVARFPAALEGKTWNHPVVIGDVLLVRNAEGMAAFRLSLAGS